MKTLLGDEVTGQGVENTQRCIMLAGESGYDCTINLRLIGTG